MPIPLLDGPFSSWLSHDTLHMGDENRRLAVNRSCIHIHSTLTE